MITLELKARLACDTAGCGEFVQVRLALMPIGGFKPVPTPAVQGWQILATPGDPTRPYEGRCPFHAQSRIVPAGGLVG